MVSEFPFLAHSRRGRLRWKDCVLKKAGINCGGQCHDSSSNLLDFVLVTSLVVCKNKTRRLKNSSNESHNRYLQQHNHDVNAG